MSQLPVALLEVIHQLIPLFGRDDFDDHFEQMAAGYTVPEQYQIRNELVRLCESCEKMIDLRGEVSGKCRKYIHKGRVHHLDELAIEAFEAGLETFGHYTVGVWESVNNTGNNFRVQQERAERERVNAAKCEQARKAEKLQHILATRLQYNAQNYPVHVIRFGDYFNRTEERMNYSVAAVLTNDEGEQMEGVTKDLSLKGIFLRVGLAEKVALDDIYKVRLSEQVKKYSQLTDNGIEYQVKRIEYLDNVIWLGLVRTFAEKNTDEINDYINELIVCNKFVYKVNLDNAIDAALKQGYEQVFFARTQSMALYVENQGSQYRLRYAMTNGLNEHHLRFFNDQDNRQHINTLFSSAQLSRLLGDRNEQTLLYCFSHPVQGSLLVLCCV